VITVLTASYNRSHTLPRLFNSLCRQNSHNFEWIVIDDGSTDDTKILLNNFKKSAPFPVRIITQPNSGKHVAINTGVLAATRDWIFIVDSDDVLTKDAIATIEKKLSEANSDMIVGLCFRKTYFDGRMIGRRASPGVLELTPTKAGALLEGDLAYVFKRESMLKNPFPVIPGEKFVPELYVWNKIGDLGKIYFFASKSICFCEYLQDGYSLNFLSNLKKNPRGFFLFYKSQISRETSVLNKSRRLIRAFQCYLYILREKIK